MSAPPLALCAGSNQPAQRPHVCAVCALVVQTEEGQASPHIVIDLKSKCSCCDETRTVGRVAVTPTYEEAH